MNSKAKGKRGELELCQYLRDHGVAARRGQQYSGTETSADVVTDIAGLHVECKRVERLIVYEFMEQAKRDAGRNTPVVMHRQNDQEWLAILRLDDFLKLVKDHIL